MEKKANSAKRLMKKMHKKTKKRKLNDDDDDSDAGDYKALAYMPTPAQQLALEQGYWSLYVTYFH